MQLIALCHFLIFCMLSRHNFSMKVIMVIHDPCSYFKIINCNIVVIIEISASGFYKITKIVRAL